MSKASNDTFSFLGVAFLRHVFFVSTTHLLEAIIVSSTNYYLILHTFFFLVLVLGLGLGLVWFFGCEIHSTLGLFKLLPLYLSKEEGGRVVISLAEIPSVTSQFVTPHTPVLLMCVQG